MINDAELTLLSEEEICGYMALDVLNKYGRVASMTDLCLLTGCDNSRKYITKKSATCMFYTRTKCQCENNEPALIIPANSSVKRLDNDILRFYFNFENIENDIHYMNKKEHFDEELKSLRCDIEINYNKDMKGTKNE